MSEPSPRGSTAGRAAPKGKADARRRIRTPEIGLDRIVLLRFALVVVVLAFLYLIVSIGMRAFGAGGEKQVKQIDRIIDATSATPAPAAGQRNDAATPGTPPSR